ncbi:MAG: type IX secretion system sortase PorU, partial [Ferruginibacter sp.]|nr:type IX secretion system sortase PorU [Ferruginibacter sp.]
MQYRYLILNLFSFIFCTANLFAQRQYAANSVLSSGDWYKIAIVKEGVYKIEAAFLNRLGIANNQPSASIRLYGNGGRPVPENNAVSRPNDLTEIAIEVFDGGDGIFNGNDFLLFYAPGPDSWQYDIADHLFHHQKNLINDTCYYFLTIQPNGKRITEPSLNIIPNTIVTQYDERVFYENDAINLLNSGKNWVGEEFNTKQNSQSFTYSLNDIVNSAPLQLTSAVLSRSIGTPGSFTVSVNGQPQQPFSIKPVSGNLIDNYAENAYIQSSINSPESILKLTYTYNTASATAQGWLDWFELQYRRKLKMSRQDQLCFRDIASVGSNNVAQFIIDGADSNTEVWDVSESLQPQKMKGILSSNQFEFNNDASILREYIAFDITQCASPIPIGKINNQNLHQSSFADYLIITPSVFIQSAERLAAFHASKNKLTVKVATKEQIYNEFGGGNASAAAIRDFIKMYYDKAGTDLSLRPKYVLLFGVGNYDTKGRTAFSINHIPCFESDISFNPLLSYTSDDFYALLGDNDDINNTQQKDELQLAVGRLPVSTSEEANTVVDKIIHYYSPSSLGSWRNDWLFLADDKDANMFLNTTEQITDSISYRNQSVNIHKIYVDAYPTTTAYNTTTSPKVNQSVTDQLQSGKLIFCYSGHGNFKQLSSYDIFTKQEAQSLHNANQLPLFITSTCDFLPYDDPSKKSLGSYLLHGSRNGVIALLTTPRLVFAGGNQIINRNFLKFADAKDLSGNYLSLGESYQLSKNLTNQTVSDIINNRKFTLIGDPALQLSFPKYHISIDSINQHAITNGDTIRSGNEYTITGFIRNQTGTILTDFNGNIYPRIFNSPEVVKTLANDPSSIATTFLQQTDVIYSGKSTVRNGKFNFTFLASTNLNEIPAKGKISLYAENSI